MSAVIEARGLSKWFGEVVAVNNLHVSVEPGVTGLLGPNGAGKSTFIKLALGLYAPSRGSVRVLGQRPRNNLEVLRRVGYCPEADKFFTNTTGYEFVFWMNRLWGMGRREAREKAETACEMVKMTARMHDPIEEYSRGMRQRIKVAQALASDPEVLFLDEPMSGLDPEGREDLFKVIRGLGEAGRTVILSTHVLYEVERITSRVLLLHNGCVLAEGDVRQIRDLIDEHPHAVTVKCRDPRKLAAGFVDDASTLSTEFVDGAVTIRTADPNAFYQQLNDLVLDDDLVVESITCPDDNLQSVFDYLIR
ncbi:MAG: ATP-binding cassette domain-containing protein [Nitrospiraceae bacterium]|nr:ATP-binding cassette domain-containing protein [Nitrospiraceae bacterium]